MSIAVAKKTSVDKRLFVQFITAVRMYVTWCLFGPDLDITLKTRIKRDGVTQGGVIWLGLSVCSVSERLFGHQFDEQHRLVDGVRFRRDLRLAARGAVLHHSASDQLAARLLASCPLRFHLHRHLPHEYPFPVLYIYLFNLLVVHSFQGQPKHYAHEWGPRWNEKVYT